MAEHYRVSLRRGEVAVEVESSDRDFVMAQLAKYRSLLFADPAPSAPPPAAAAPTAPAPPAPASPPAAPKGLTMAELARAVRPSTDTEYVTTALYYTEKVEGRPEVRTGDLVEKFEQVKYRCSNPSDAVARAKKLGLVSDGEARRTHTLTRSGERWVEARLPDEAVGEG